MEKVFIKFKVSGEFSKIEVEHCLYMRGVEDILKQIREQVPHDEFVEMLKTTSEEGEIINI